MHRAGTTRHCIQPIRSFFVFFAAANVIGFGFGVATTSSAEDTVDRIV